MKIRISIEELRARTLFVGSPMYAGQCYGLYANSLLRLGIAFAQQGLTMQFAPVFNDSLVPRARNTIADAFMRSDLTHFLFIDADIEFAPEDVLTLLALADPGSDKDVVCGMYPKKHIAWAKIKAAVEQDYDVEDLEEFVGELVMNPEGRTGSYSLYDPLDVKETGTGFMLIQRHVFERFIEAYPELYYYAFDGNPHKVTCFFDTWIDPETHRYLSEDYNFCRLIKAIGMKVWVAPWLNLSHLGYYKFKGNAGAVSALAEAAPAPEAVSIPYQ